MGEMGFRLADRDFPLSLFSEVYRSAIDRYLKFMEAESTKGAGAVPFISDAEFKSEGSGNMTTKSIPQRPPIGRIPPSEATSIELFCEEFAKKSGESIDTLTSKARQRDIALVRREFIRQAIRKGFMMTQIAHLLNRTRSAISKAYNQFD